MYDKLYIYGASGHGRVVADVAVACGWEEIEFFDDRYPELLSNGQWPVVGGWNELLHCLKKNKFAFIAIGDNSIREKKQYHLESEGATLPALVHPSAVLGSDTLINSGVVVMPLAVVNSGAVIGRGAIVNTAAVLEHGVGLGAFAHVGPNCSVAGDVVINEGVWLGISSTIINGCKIGKWSIIGAGAVVINNVQSNITVVGSPAKLIRRED